MAEARSGGFTVGNGYRCDIGGIVGWNPAGYNYNNYPVFYGTEDVFQKNVVYTCLEKRMGYRSNFQQAGEDKMFCRMDNGWWVAEFNSEAFTTVSGS